MNSPTSQPAVLSHSQAEHDRDHLLSCYQDVRRTTESLCFGLETEDYVVQSMPDASPTKWHVAHTSWFFETFVLAPNLTGQPPVSPQFAYLFNSYYNAVGERIARDQRGLLSRPTVAEVYHYRKVIDDRMRSFLEGASVGLLRRIGPTITLGLHHEQQHQELILTDLKHAFGVNPIRPSYREARTDFSNPPGPARWLTWAEGLRKVGHDGGGFAFDNELPRHQVYVESFQLADRLVTNGEYLAFMTDGGYERPEFWLSDGWNARKAQGWTAPLYWEQAGQGWQVFTLGGMSDMVEGAPVCHVSYYEADAYARWAGARLATEAEWEVAAADCLLDGNFLENERFRPLPVAAPTDLTRPSQLFGDVWEWTRSPYSPYPGYEAAAGALGEYNGKFMCNQMVLRGGSCVTPRSHIRPTYRNFFPPEARWQFSGIRLAKDC